MPFFPKKYLFCLLFHTNTIGYIQVLHFHSLLVTFLFFSSLSGAERHRELPSDPQLCANLPPLKWKSNGHRLTRCFMLENWNFVFPVLFQGWAVDFFIHSARILPGISSVCLELTSKQDRHSYLQTDFRHLDTKALS